MSCMHIRPIYINMSSEPAECLLWINRMRAVYPKQLTVGTTLLGIGFASMQWTQTQYWQESASPPIKNLFLMNREVSQNLPRRRPVVSPSSFGGEHQSKSHLTVPFYQGNTLLQKQWICKLEARKCRSRQHAEYSLTTQTHTRKSPGLDEKRQHGRH